MRVAAVQMTSTSDKVHNLAEAHRLLIKAVKQKAELVAFPETFSQIAPREFIRDAESWNGLFVKSLQEWAIDHKIWILAGSLPFKIPGNPRKVTNTSLLISSEGEIVARYDKIHLFDAQVGKRSYCESKYFKPGETVVVAPTPFGKVGLSVCYDLRFPELYRAQALKGARIIFAPAAFTAATGEAHWDILTRARAIENEVFIIAPAQAGTPYPGREMHGHTRIVDPWGKVLAEQKSGTGLAIADLDFKEQERIRATLPVLKHQRLVK